ncbi:hypothetical protein C8Q76DRAFT_635418 [Earliella scabrosa]|nr:hypothetical protein C8Q76DRAFT_635418 [Earliella scabrosa]
MSSTPPTHSKLAPYRQALAAISQRTRTPLPSLLVSFAVLHELTAIVPLAGLFFSARALGVGEGVVAALVPRPGAETASTGFTAHVRDSWVGERFREWMVEGETRAERVGRRYGWFGFEQGSKPVALSPEERATHTPESVLVSGKIAGDVANAVVAYAMTKALLPIRIGMSLYLSPAFSRTIIQPIGSAFSRVARRRSP